MDEFKDGDEVMITDAEGLHPSLGWLRWRRCRVLVVRGVGCYLEFQSDGKTNIIGPMDLSRGFVKRKENAA